LAPRQDQALRQMLLRSKNWKSAHKSEQILELRKEVISLRNQIATEVSQSLLSSVNYHCQFLIMFAFLSFQSTKGTPTKKSFAFQEREKELQKEIRGLNKQVRTLQKILYSKDGGATREDLIHSSQDCLASPLKGPEGTKHKEPQVHVLECRIAELERNLVQADADAKDRLKDFQGRLNALKVSIKIAYFHIRLDFILILIFLEQIRRPDERIRITVARIHLKDSIS
jgi:hypothetical protein